MSKLGVAFAGRPEPARYVAVGAAFRSYYGVRLLIDSVRVSRVYLLDAVGEHVGTFRTLPTDVWTFDASGGLA